MAASSSIIAAKNTKESEKGTKIMCVFSKAYNGDKSCQNHYNYIFKANQVPHIGFDQYIACRRYNRNIWLKTRNNEIEKSEHILNNVLGDIYNNVSLSILRITKYIIYVFLSVAKQYKHSHNQDMYDTFRNMG